ncbi:MAG: chemotaxis protein CheD [Oscillospiraceae bacterium]
MSEIIKIGIADMKIGKDQDVLVTYALGSCVGICMYDKFLKIGGLSHILLPAHTKRPDGTLEDTMKYGDTAIIDMLQKMEKMGCKRANITTKIAGGAQMFNLSNTSSVSNMGAKNLIVVKKVLNSLNIPIVSHDVGKNYGRTLFFSISDGFVKVKSAIKGEIII